MSFAANMRNASFLPAEMVARKLRTDKDAIEEMARLLLGKMPTTPTTQRLLGIVTSLRMARSRKYAAMQRIVPAKQISLLGVLAILITLTPFLDGKGDTTEFAQVLYGVLVEVLVFVTLTYNQ